MRKQFKFDFRFMVRALFCAAICMLWLGVPATAQWPTIITINPPGAGNAASLGTQAPGINPAGVVTGFFTDSNNVAHGFLRTPGGAIFTFDAPGAGSKTVPGFHTTPAGVPGGQGTFSVAINPAGVIAGTYFDDNSAAHGFLRTPGGTITTIDAPSYVFTSARNISPRGAIAGVTRDTSFVFHGFLRSPDGEFTIFDAPDAGKGGGQGTFMGSASCINAAGAVTGWYVDGSGVSHGYVRDPDGRINEFDVPGAEGTYSWSINDEGAVTADYVDKNGVTHGYVRDRDGRITEFDIPGAGTTSGQGTAPEGINNAGTTAGNYIDAIGANHGFARDRDGRITEFDAPGAGTGSGHGTIPMTNNSAGAITGAYFDDQGVLHGFLRTAGPPSN